MDLQWKPKIWIGVLLGVFFQAYTFLYLNRLKVFWLYFVSIAVVAIFDWYFHLHWVLIFSVICPVHAYWAAKLADVKLIVPQKQYFFLGNNRDNSADSRVWGFVSDDNFIGEVTYIYHK